MTPLDVRKCTESDKYAESEVWIELVSKDGSVSCGAMQRCGVTHPPYHDHPTYRMAGYDVAPWQGPIYVYEDGYFYPMIEWYENADRKQL
jgi:hypothetical protein